MDSIFGGEGDDLLDGVEIEESHQDNDARDFLNGGRGDDTIIAGNEDFATGGEGADTIVAGHWINDGAAHFNDFDPAEDQVVVVFDDTSASEPSVDVQSPSSDSSGPTILLDGVPILTLQPGATVDLGDISLIGHSTIQAL